MGEPDPCREPLPRISHYKKYWFFLFWFLISFAGVSDTWTRMGGFPTSALSCISHLLYSLLELTSVGVWHIVLWQSLLYIVCIPGNEEGWYQAASPATVSKGLGQAIADYGGPTKPAGAQAASSYNSKCILKNVAQWKI